MPTGGARTESFSSPPSWAVLQRRLFDVLDVGRRRFTDRYTEPDGRLRYPFALDTRDGVDDFYESFFNWPTLYLLGGADDLLDACKHHWSGVTAQLTEMGMLIDEFERGYDWFHLGESMLLFYGICAADPADEGFAERADRFARLYLADSPTGNYDAATATIRAPHNGSGGPRWGLDEAWDLSYPQDQSMGHWGLPLMDLPGITRWSDLDDPAQAARMGSAMKTRMGQGDTAINLGCTSLLTNAWLSSGADDLRRWVLDYTDAWCARLARFGVLPDNVGPSGAVGELHGGQWFGGHYGWTWPHGLHSVGAAGLVGGMNAYLVGGDPDALDLGRNPFDVALSHGRRGVIAEADMSLRDIWKLHLGSQMHRFGLLVPNRRGPRGWFDFQPAPMPFATWLWHLSGAAEDRERIDHIRAASGYDWDVVLPFRDKMESGHEEPWLEFLSGRNPRYPELILTAAIDEATQRMSSMEQETEPRLGELHFWQARNPVLTEALLQLTTGTPQVLYNGGLLTTRLRHYDADRRRPGLPPDVAALVSRLDEQGLTLELVNLSSTSSRRVLVAAGAFGEHRFLGPGDTRVASVLVELPPLHRAELDLTMALRVVTPAHQSISSFS